MPAQIKVLPDPSNDPWPTLWASFERSLRAESPSPRTLDIYGEGGRQFHAFCLTRRLTTDPREIDKGMVEDFLIYLREEKSAKAATLSARFSALRRFFSWLEAEGEIERSPMDRMRGPKVEVTPPDVITEEDQRKILDASKGSEFEDRRDMALIRLMLDAGLRRGEVVGMTLDDLNLDAQSIVIMGKGARPSIAFFGAKTARDLIVTFG